MKFAAVIDYARDPAKIEQIRPTHRQYLRTLLETGKLFASGPFTDDSGALIIYEAETAEQAEQILKGDPFHAAGIFLKWQIKPWKIVMGNPTMIPA
ncbi:MAG: YciI family protein [Planctomycetes bacterium]|nr:YciI family protein [Planctomycetota bacterium]